MGCLPSKLTGKNKQQEDAGDPTEMSRPSQKAAAAAQGSEPGSMTSAALPVKSESERKEPSNEMNPVVFFDVAVGGEFFVFCFLFAFCFFLFVGVCIWG